jgi:protein-ribulosamine 3-kinase
MSQLPLTLKHKLEEALAALKGEKVIIDNFFPSSGGCINNGGKLSTSKGVFFVKWNSAERYPGMFRAESMGLSLLRATETLDAPEPLCAGEAHEFQFLILGFIQGSLRAERYWENLGSGLAALHKKTAKAFGLAYSNYIGSLPQSNTPRISWVEFLVRERFEKQLGLTDPNDHQINRLRKKFELLYAKLPGILIQESPSLLHGDLWSGNIMVSDQGQPSIIDPAVYYGNREVDIAMTQLFGGFQKEFYQSYQYHFPMENGFQERLDVYNLYPLLVHLNLFGGSYLQQINLILKKFV